MVAVALLTAGNASAASPERLLLPYSCAKHGAQIAVARSQHTFEVLGPHETRRIPLCRIAGRIPGTAGCSAIDLHRFDVMCGNKRVAWADVAAAIAVRAPAVPRDAQRQGPNLACGLAPPSGRLGASLLCRWPSRGTPLVHVGLPAGFAPVAEAGGKLLGPAVAATANARQRPGLMQTLVTSSPLPDITPAVATVEEPPAITAAATSVLESAERHGAALPFLLIGLLATVASAGAAAWRWPHQARRAKAVAARGTLKVIEFVERNGAGLTSKVQGLQATARFVPRHRVVLRQPADLRAANAATAVSAMLSETTLRLADLRGAGPLADVLNQEIGQLRQRLTTLTVAAGESDEQAARASPGFRNLMRDIERVRRIADSAAISMGAGRNAARIPRTKSEAYDLLGLNPDAPDGTLKKVADGLRMSWHPDHAKDAGDRAEREARIKAINIAVELINGKRAA